MGTTLDSRDIAILTQILASHTNQGGTCNCGNRHLNWQLHLATVIAEQFKGQRKETNVSAVLWCDKGDHAFKAGTPGSQSFRGETVGRDGQPEIVFMDVCPEHSLAATQPAIEGRE